MDGECLHTNWQGSYTVPSARMYPHQFNWDSAFSAIGWAALRRPSRAYTELETLVGSQHVEGMIPHVVFSTNGSYFPAADWWPAKTGKDGRLTTSISNPAVAAIALRRIYEEYPDPVRALPLARKLAAWHGWWLSVRDPHSLGEPVIIHPWETGRDNSPEWDQALSAVPVLEVEQRRRDHEHVERSQRPSTEHYRHFLWLVANISKMGGDQKLLATYGPFQMLDVGMSSILAAACGDLAWVAEQLADRRLMYMARDLQNKIEDSLALRSRAGLAGVIDLRAGVADDTPSAGWALNILRRDLDEAAIARIEHEVLEGSLSSPYGVRSWSSSDEHFEEHRYWRGPVWVNITWLVILGLERHHRASAKELRERVLKLPEYDREYYDGDTGQGLGAECFSWSAALTLDLRS